MHARTDSLIQSGGNYNPVLARWFRLLEIASSQGKHQMQNGAPLHLIIGCGFVIIPVQIHIRTHTIVPYEVFAFVSRNKRKVLLHLFAGENQTLLLRRNALLLLHALLDAVHFVGGLDIDLDLLAGERLPKWPGMVSDARIDHHICLRFFYLHFDQHIACELRFL